MERRSAPDHITEEQAAQWCDVPKLLFTLWVESGAPKPVACDERGRWFDAEEIGRLAIELAELRAKNGEDNFGRA